MARNEQESDSPQSSPVFRVLGPTVLDLVVVVLLCMTFSFRYTGIIAVLFVYVVFRKWQLSLPRFAAMATMVGVFLAPIDIRFASSSTHYGESTQFISLVPTFSGQHTAHSKIRRMHPEYYTSLVINRSSYVVSIDFRRLFSHPAR